ncbi:hypothetical protein DSUL_20049 [Desulfovibrionales bacterium]
MCHPFQHKKQRQHITKFFWNIAKINNSPAVVSPDLHVVTISPPIHTELTATPNHILPHKPLKFSRQLYSHIINPLPREKAGRPS